MDEHQPGGKDRSPGLTAGIDQLPLLDERPGEQNWTGSRQVAGCLFCFLGDPVDDVEGRLEGRAVPLRASLTAPPTGLRKLPEPPDF